MGNSVSAQAQIKSTSNAAQKPAEGISAKLENFCLRRRRIFHIYVALSVSRTLPSSLTNNCETEFKEMYQY